MPANTSPPNTPSQCIADALRGDKANTPGDADDSASSGASFFSDYVTIRLEYNELLAVLDVDAWNGGVSYLAAHNVECRSIFVVLISLDS